MINYFGLTDVGLFREENQDSYFCNVNKNGDLLALVCDGIGGGLAGDVASKVATNHFENFKENSGFKDINDLKNYLSLEIKKTNDEILKTSSLKNEYSGMGTTITGICITSIGVVSFNVGDSRSYGINDELVQLTDDDSLVNEMLKKGEITYEESLNHPKKHYLIKALGIYSDVLATIKEEIRYKNYLICSDGLHGFVSKNEIEEVLTNDETDCKKKCEELLSLALLKGGYDNITIIVVSENE